MKKPQVRRSSWIYMVATHLGTACLLPMFLIFGAHAGSLDFDRFAHSLPQPLASICFILALIGFGTKAGIIPFHVWLPEAHPAAPSHVSALMSGIMIKTGIYGIVRMLTFFGVPPLWWGWLVLAIGIISGVLGVLFALAQHDLKGLLAYHSVENIGIIMMGLGVGLIGWSAGCSLCCHTGYGRRAFSCGQSCAVQGPALSGGRLRVSGRAYQGDRPSWRPYQKNALYRRLLSRRSGRHFRACRP